MIAPGRYVCVTDLSCWKSFTLHANGCVEFVDAIDGHVSTWSTRSPEGADWIADMQKRIDRGDLRKEG